MRKLGSGPAFSQERPQTCIRAQKPKKRGSKLNLVFKKSTPAKPVLQAGAVKNLQRRGGFWGNSLTR
jgi:hypothetical protein